MKEKGERVKKLREHLGLTQGEFAEKLGFKQSMLSSIENGNRKLTETMISALYTRFNARPEWIKRGTGSMLDGVVSVELSDRKGITDLDALETILFVIENYLYTNNKIIEPRKKAKLISSLYKFYLEGNYPNINEFSKKIESSIEVAASIVG